MPRGIAQASDAAQWCVVAEGGVCVRRDQGRVLDCLHANCGSDLMRGYRKRVLREAKWPT